MDNLVEIKNNHVVVSTIQIADKFEKQHKDVLRLTSVKLRSSNGDRLLQHFFKTTYTDEKGEQRPMYLMDRDGFCFLVMGFTGEKADKWKLDFIDAFNAMEAKLNQQQQSTLAYDKYISLLDDKFKLPSFGQKRKTEPWVKLDNPEFRSILNEVKNNLTTINTLLKYFDRRYLPCAEYSSYFLSIDRMEMNLSCLLTAMEGITFETISASEIERIRQSNT
ncbi:Rha family transcriptional regulator [Megamonas hypermegale]|uniref:Rha family transcriptional regulator n=1 Tax=Megamonas hypermegale TaxID=158847 RepID=UPI0026F344E3|nr:Rha family transcriptional regulator [Megamonas hypermegale]